MAPKFSNPHLLRQTTQPVTRADIDAEHDLEESGDVSSGNILALENILKRTLGEFQLSLVQDPPSKDVEHKRKRLKVEEPEESVCEYRFHCIARLMWLSR
jgi:hypothetical protein